MMLSRDTAGKAKSVIILILCGVLVSMPVAAQRFSFGDSPMHPPRLILARGGGESLNSAVARLRKQTGGRVLSAETRQEGGSRVHYIRILTRDGKVKRFKVVAN